MPRERFAAGQAATTCLAMARLNKDELRALKGFSINTNETRRIAQRMRRAGAVLLARPELQERCKAMTLRDVLLTAEREGRGLRFTYV